MWRSLCGLLVAASCVADDPVPVDPPPDPLDTIWADSVRANDLIVAIPGTGGYTGLGAIVDAAVDAQHTATPLIDARVTHDFNPIVLEQGIATAQRAGFTSSQIEAGSVTLALWGAGIT